MYSHIQLKLIEFTDTFLYKRKRRAGKGWGKKKLNSENIFKVHQNVKE